MGLGLSLGLAVTADFGPTTPPVAAAPTDISLSAASVQENASVGSVVAFISANGYPSPTFAEVADPDSKFTVSGNQLLLGAALDYETTTTHSVTISATNSEGSYQEAFTITVVDVDDTAPTITSSASPSVAENADFSHTLTASEAVTWSIVGGADAALFSLAGSTLSMTAKDYETPTDADANNAYVVTVRATDGAGNTADQTITVTVTDVVEGYVFTNTEASDLVARFTTEPDDTRKGHIDTLVGSLKSAGVWAKLDVLYVMAAHDAQAARRNWKGNVYNLTAVSSPTFTVDRGYTGDGASAYLSSGYAPGFRSVLASQDSTCQGVWIRTELTNNGAAVSNRFFRIIPRNTSGSLLTGNAQTGLVGVGVSASAGHAVHSRGASTGYDRYKNNSALAAVTAASTALVDVDTFILCDSNFGTAEGFSPHQVAVMHQGSYLTSTEVTGLYNALSTYLTAVGA